LKTLEQIIQEVLDNDHGVDLARTLAAHVRGHLYAALLDRATDSAGTDYRLGYEDGIRESARWMLRAV
jgi:hypothetical protein